MWRALVAGRRGEFSGTWTSTADLSPDTPLAGMLEQAAGRPVNGAWQSARQSGDWSIPAAR
jgi:hypothetical protein